MEMLLRKFIVTHHQTGKSTEILAHLFEIIDGYAKLSKYESEWGWRIVYASNMAIVLSIEEDINYDHSSD